MTRASLLTPLGTAAIAVVGLKGPDAWSITRSCFRPVTKPLPETPNPGLMRYGHIGSGTGDEVMLLVPPGVVTSEPVVEIHCHGGKQVVRMILDLLVASGAVLNSTDTYETWEANTEQAYLLRCLSQAPTARWCSWLLDQLHGAYEHALNQIVNDIQSAQFEQAKVSLEKLRAFAPLTRHATSPFRVALVGPPNVGKSSLMNALAGFTRSIVSPTAGTTRDIVTQDLAIDGIPVQLIDTAGLRESTDPLEREGISRSQRLLEEADLVLQLYQAGQKKPQPIKRAILVATKLDLNSEVVDGIGVSSITQAGLQQLLTATQQHLVPVFPQPGDAVPTQEEDLELLSRASAQLQQSPQSACGLLAMILKRLTVSIGQ